MFVLLSAIFLVFPHVGNHVSRAAVVNAPIVSIKTPFDGIFNSGPLLPAEAVQAGQPVLAVTASLASRAELARLGGRLVTLRGEAGAILDEIDALTALDLKLTAQTDAIRVLAHDILRLRREGVEGELSAAVERRRRLSDEAARLRQLQGTAVSEARASEASSLAEEALGEVRRLDAELRQIAREVEGVETGAIPALGTEDGSYAQQRRDELVIRLADLRSRHRRLEAEIAGLEIERSALARQIGAFGTFEPVAPDGAVIWTPSPFTGAAVAAGDEVVQLLDCARRFIEVVIPEHTYGAIGAGDRARVVLVGSEGAPFEAVVEAVRGSGGRPETGRLAAQPEEIGPGMISVLLRLPPPDLSDPAVSGNFCDVGRTGEVYFDRRFDETWLAFRDRWADLMASLDGRIRQAMAE